MRTPLLVHRWTSSCCVLTWWKGWGSSLGGPFPRALIPFLRAPPSFHEHLPAAPSPTNMLGVKIPNHEFQDDPHISASTRGTLGRTHRHLSSSSLAKNAKLESLHEETSDQLKIRLNEKKEKWEQNEKKEQWVWPQTGSRTGGGKAIKHSEVKGHGLYNFAQMGQRKRKGCPVYLHRSVYIGKWGQGGKDWTWSRETVNCLPYVMWVEGMWLLSVLFTFCDFSVNLKLCPNMTLKKRDIYKTIEEICTVTRYELMIEKSCWFGGNRDVVKVKDESLRLTCTCAVCAPRPCRTWDWLQQQVWGHAEKEDMELVAVGPGDGHMASFYRLCFCRFETSPKCR